jgi:hypothetical protein
VPFAFSSEKVELLADMGHERWVAERLQADWSCGPESDAESKTNAYLVGYDELPNDAKEWDRRAIPEILALVGVEVHRLAVCYSQSRRRHDETIRKLRS